MLDLDVIAAKFALGMFGTEMYDIADRFVAAGEIEGGFFEIVLLGRDASVHDIAPLFNQALNEKGIRLPTRGEAAVIVAKDYVCPMLRLGEIDVYAINRDIYELLFQAETDDQLHALGFLHFASEACDYAIASKVHKHYKAECELGIRALCESQV